MDKINRIMEILKACIPLIKLVQKGQEPAKDNNYDKGQFKMAIMEEI
jgi:hypothetical protein